MLKVKTASLHVACKMPGMGLEGCYTLQPDKKHKGLVLEWNSEGLWVSKPTSAGVKLFLIPTAGVQTVEFEPNEPKEDKKK